MKSCLFSQAKYYLDIVSGNYFILLNVFPKPLSKLQHWSKNSKVKRLSDKYISKNIKYVEFGNISLV